MKKILKILSLCLGVIFIAGVSFILRLETQPPAVAQTDYVLSDSLICDEIIPIGETIEETKDFMNEIYKTYQDAHDMLNLVLPSLTTEIVALTKQRQEVCDFSECKPAIKDKGLNVEVNITGVGEQNVVDIHTPICYADECSGEPCPDLGGYLMEATGAPGPLVAGADGFSTIDGVIDDLFNTKFESISQKIQLARELLHPGYTGSCAQTDKERAMVEAGEMGTKFPARCVDALAEGLYWPKMSPKECETPCSPEVLRLSGDNKPCMGCIETYGGNSVLAKINYKIYGECGMVCIDELTQECANCLCDGKTEKECIAWLCSGSYYNWVCCHETPLE